MDLLEAFHFEDRPRKLSSCFDLSNEDPPRLPPGDLPRVDHVEVLTRKEGKKK